MKTRHKHITVTSNLGNENRTCERQFADPIGVRRLSSGPSNASASRVPQPSRRRAASFSGRQRRRAANATVVGCYELLDRIFPQCGLLDFTEGMYLGDETVSYEAAQRNQADWLLDQVGCGLESRVLDIGCGNGTLLEAATQRGARAVGITISPQQVDRCCKRGLDARLMNYLDIDSSWDGTFDAIVANGSIEHFVQPGDMVFGLQDKIYRELFEICYRLLDPQSLSGRLATTVIHFARFYPKSRDLMRGPSGFKPFSDSFHFALLKRAMGGCYPRDDQLARCASPYFALVDEVDGTLDYRRTSEEWLRRVRESLYRGRKVPHMIRQLLPYALRHPRHCVFSLALIVTESWQWQFRGDDPPMRLLRQVWQR